MLQKLPVHKSQLWTDQATTTAEVTTSWEELNLEIHALSIKLQKR
jgi:hypothetical protein